MLWLKAFHLIFVVCWFSGLFYLPRLFVYHALAADPISLERFKVMEKKLFYAITLPSAIVATGLGIIILSHTFEGYMQLGWMRAKLVLVMLLWIYTLMCAKYVHDFCRGKNKHSSKYYRYFNELPALLLAGIIILVIVKPFLALTHTIS